MAETLTELVAKISTDATELKKGLSEGEKATEASSKRMSESLKKVGMAMAASGAAITAALGLMGKAAIDEEINIKRLATTINNSGMAYDNVKDSLEAVIAATQRKTGIADDEQRDVLNRLILVTNDYAKAMELLPTALDLAAAGEMDAATAATYLGKAYLDLENGAESVSVRFGQASLKFKNMEDIQNRVAGAAENLVNPLNVLKASIGDVAEEIGMSLLPLIKDITNKIVDIAIKVQEWTKENPKLASTLTKVGLALGVMLTIVGGLILIMPTLISGVAAFGVVFHAALGPIGLISIAVMALTTAGVLLWKDWDKIWPGIKKTTVNVINTIIYWINKFIDVLNSIPFVNIARINEIDFTPAVESLQSVTEATTEASAKIAESAVVSKAAYKAAAESAEESADRQTKALEEVWKKIQAFNEKMQQYRNQLMGGVFGLRGSGAEYVSEYGETLGGTTAEVAARLIAAQQAKYGEVRDPAIIEWLKSEGITGYATGGIIPGVKGSPQLIMAHGGETIVPEGQGGITIINNIEGSVISEYDLAYRIRQQLINIKERNVTSGI